MDMCGGEYWDKIGRFPEDLLRPGAVVFCHM